MSELRSEQSAFADSQGAVNASSGSDAFTGAMMEDPGHKFTKSSGLNLVSRISTTQNLVEI